MCQWKAIYEQAIKDSNDIDPKEDDTVLSFNTIMFEWDFFQALKYGEGFVCVESHQNMNFTAL